MDIYPAYSGSIDPRFRYVGICRYGHGCFTGNRPGDIAVAAATPAELEASLDRLCELDDPDPEEEYWDCDLTAGELADIREAAADEVLAVEAASTGRRGPGHPGSARVFPGESASTAAGFGTGMALDVTPGCPQLAVAADAAAGGGDKDCFDGVADHELIGLLCAWDRLEAHMAARKLAVAAELFRRNPEDGFEPSPGAMPEVVSEFGADQLACALADSRDHANWMLTVAWHLATRLTGTMAALRDGVIGVHLHPHQPGWAAHWVRHLAVAYPRARSGPDRHPRLHPHRPVRASIRSQGA